MIDTIEKTDLELKNDVLAELKYEPTVKVTDIGVLVKNGTVTLNGYVSSYVEKLEAVQAVKRIAGVKAIADDIEIQLPESYHRTDGDIAAAATNQINWATLIPPGTVRVTVSEGWIELEGEVDGWHQKTLAGSVVRHLSGVKGVSNRLSLAQPIQMNEPTVKPVEVERAIKSAFKRSAVVDANKIRVETAGSNVELSGNVRNLAEREEAERAAWAAPGVFSVDNQLTVKWFEFSQ
ncbi:BON domain-containing protein [Chamaesiphon sp.]|uniref:BON domain-containing protein n=1 Tax=Chamaesiphon sp. TaxID=2814140 RepID=UPI003593C580